MRKISEEKKTRVLRLYLTGNSYDQIAEKEGLSRGSVSNIVQGLREGKTLELRGLDQLADQLRELAVRLRKQGMTPTQARLGLEFLLRLQDMGVEPRALQEWIAFSRRLCSERGEPGLIDAAIRLLELERRVGKPYPQMMAEVATLADELDGQRGKLNEQAREIQEREGKKTALEAELAEAERKVRLFEEGLATLISSQEHLQRVGLERAGALARFIEDFEALGFDAGQVKELAGVKRALAEAAIDPYRLTQFLQERGPLSAQLSRLRSEVKKLKEEKQALESEMPNIRILHQGVKAGTVVLPCRNCDGPITVHLASPSKMKDTLHRGLAFWTVCSHCGSQMGFSSWDMLLQVGVAALEIGATRPQ